MESIRMHKQKDTKGKRRVTKTNPANNEKKRKNNGRSRLKSTDKGRTESKECKNKIRVLQGRGGKTKAQRQPQTDWVDVADNRRRPPAGTRSEDEAAAHSRTRRVQRGRSDGGRKPARTSGDQTQRQRSGGAHPWRRLQRTRIAEFEVTQRCGHPAGSPAGRAQDEPSAGTGRRAWNTKSREERRATRRDARE